MELFHTSHTIPNYIHITPYHTLITARHFDTILQSYHIILHIRRADDTHITPISHHKAFIHYDIGIKLHHIIPISRHITSLTSGHTTSTWSTSYAYHSCTTQYHIKSFWYCITFISLCITPTARTSEPHHNISSLTMPHNFHIATQSTTESVFNVEYFCFLNFGLQPLRYFSTRNTWVQHIP